MPESITCPRCKKTSHNERDVKERFCSRCGYHDDIPPMPDGARLSEVNVRAGTLREALEKVANGTGCGWTRSLVREALLNDDVLLIRERERDRAGRR